MHNASMLGAAMLARTWQRHRKESQYLHLATAAMEYSCTRMRPDGSWLYGEEPRCHWVDNFHTGYNLDSLKCYIDNTGDRTWEPELYHAFAYFTSTFFEANGRPKYYHDRTYPIDIQCSSQAVETLAKFADVGPDVLPLAERVRELDDRSDAGSERLLLLSPVSASRRQDSDDALGTGHHVPCARAAVDA